MCRDLAVLGLLAGACQTQEQPPPSSVDETGTLPPSETGLPACEAPGLELGTGETEFRPLQLGETLSMVHGVQGGYHVPLAVRACGVGESGQFHYLGMLETGEDIVNVLLTQWWLPEDRCCSVALDVYGYIFLDGGRLPPELAGAPLDLEVELLDSTGLSLTDRVQIVLGAPVN